MLENIKSILLFLLVLSSTYLTWQLWTYQPQYDYINPTEYVVHEGLAERKEVHELIRPEILVFHYGKDKHTVSYPEMFQFRIISEQMANWYFYNFKLVLKSDHQSLLSKVKDWQGIEFVFTTGISMDLIQEVYKIRVENIDLPIINRIHFYQEGEGEEVFAMFVSEEGQQIYTARTSLTLPELRNYLALGENRPEYKPYIFGSPAKEDVYPVYYLPTGQIEMQEYRYFYQTIPVESMLQYLFVDPSLARQIQERGGASFYTDGSRGLYYDQQQYTMYFFHPSAQYSQTEALSDSYVQRSVQFVNQHKGFDQQFYLYNIQRAESEQKGIVQFRKYLGNHPIYADTPENDQNVIQLEVQNDRVTGYLRPMFELDRVINQYTRKLPSGEELVATLKEEGVTLSKIRKIKLGYRLMIQEYYLTYRPFWVVELNQGERYFINQAKFTPLPITQPEEPAVESEEELQENGQDESKEEESQTESESPNSTTEEGTSG